MDQRNGLLNVLPVLAWISELQKIAGPDTLLAKVLTSNCDLIDARPFVHGRQNLLGSRLYSHPGLRAAGAVQRLDCLRGHQIDARLHLERDRGIQSVYFRREFRNPLWFEPEDVISKPQMFRSAFALQLPHLLGDTLWPSDREVVAIDGFRTPVAAVGTATAGNDVQCEKYVRRLTSSRVLADGHKI